MLKRILIPEIVRAPGDQAVRSQGWSEGSEEAVEQRSVPVSWAAVTGEPAILGRGANHRDYP